MITTTKKTALFGALIMAVGLLCANGSVYAQTIVTGYEHGSEQGREDVMDMAKLKNPNGPGFRELCADDDGSFMDDEWTAIKVADGYRLRIEEHCPSRSKNSAHLWVTGTVKDLTHTYKPDGSNWDNQISWIYVAPAEKQELPKYGGLFYFSNPYKQAVVRAKADGKIETFNDNFRYSYHNGGICYDGKRFAWEKPELHFALVPTGEDGYYYIFNVTTGYALMPEGANESGFSAKAGDKISSYEFGGQEKWAAFKLEPTGSPTTWIFTLKGNRMLALTMGADSNGEMTLQPNEKEAAQQFDLNMFKYFDGTIPTPKKIKDDKPVDNANYDLLEYLGAGEGNPNRLITVEVPFYMVNDPKLTFMEKMEQSPYYTLERREFVKSMDGGMDAWTYNNRASSQSITYTIENTVTKGSSKEVSVNTGLEQSFTVEASTLFVTASATTTFSLDLGFSSNSYSEQSTTASKATTYNLEPCAKGKVYALANRITLKRKDGTEARSFVMYKKGTEQAVSIPLDPQTCPTVLGDPDAAKKAQASYDIYMRRAGQAKSGADPTIPISASAPTPTPTPTPTPAPTSPTPTPAPANTAATPLPAPNTCCYVENQANAYVMDVAGSSTVNGGEIVLWGKHGGPNQQFQLVDAGDGYFCLKNTNSGKVADWSGKMLQWDQNGGKHQQFKLVPAGGDYYQLEIRSAPGNVVEAVSGQLQVKPQTDSPTQKFRFAACGQ